MFKQLYLSPTGRSSRKFYWLFGVAPFVVIGFLLSIIDFMLRLEPYIVYGVSIIVIWPMLAMQIKRWHDIGATGWLSLLTFVPYLGWATSLILGFIPSSKNNNQYGNAPLKNAIEETSP